ncbi:hypothetical protein GKZ28_26060 [Clostridium chromiireducens]|uniref:Uncharacterized protein n=1 Tax=Clostridium chromiireducens TaxID=225345 RepID=A0A964W5B8_9CLOT|nr:hypothetical protein [Clostridium chromiireducens]MVX67118.1 hypothetical protein [Clostridium chromiireducens]
MRGLRGSEISLYDLIKSNPYKITNEEFRKTMSMMELQRIIEKQGYKEKTINNYLTATYEMLFFLDLINIDVSEVRDSDIELYNKILIRRGYNKPQARRKINRIKKCIYTYAKIFGSMPNGAISIVTEIRKGNSFDLAMLGNSIDFLFSSMITGLGFMSKFENGIHEIQSETWGRTHTITYKNMSSHKIMCLDLDYYSKQGMKLSNMVSTYMYLVEVAPYEREREILEQQLKILKLKSQIEKLNLKLQENEPVEKEEIEQTIRELKVVVRNDRKKEKEMREVAHRWLEEKKKVA